MLRSESKQVDTFVDLHTCMCIYNYIYIHMSIYIHISLIYVYIHMSCIRVAFRHTCEYSHNVYWQHATYTRIQVHVAYIHVHVREYMYMLIFAHAKIRVHTYVHYILHASVLDAHTNLDIDILNIHMYSHVSAYMHLFRIVCWWCRLNHDAPTSLIY